MNLQVLAQSLVEICRLAGDAIKEVYNGEVSPLIKYKSDHSPVTEADNKSHAIIVDALIRLTPDIPILSEEQEIPSFAERSSWQRYWLVDPLDGTREFIDRNGEFTVNIALIENNKPILGIVYLPLDDQAYWGGDKLGAWKVGPEGKVPLQVGGLPSENIRVLTSGRHHNQELALCIEKLRGQFNSLEQIKVGSALKFCRLVEGAGDIYPRFSPCCEWDTAAGQAVLEAAGGVLVTTDYQPFLYNLKESLINPHFFALASTLDKWRPVLT